ncbi:MAG: type II secretion system protein GspL [Rhodoferax sp.]
MPTLILTPPASLPPAAPTCAAVWTHDGATVQRQTQAPLALLAPGEGTDTVVLVPLALLSWHRLELPRGTLARTRMADGTRLRAVLHGMLEDRLLDDAEHLHLALQPQAQDGEPVWVAACDHAWLKAWLDALEQAGHAVSRIVPEAHPTLPGEPAHLHVLGPQDRPVLVTCTGQGVLPLPLDATSQTLCSAMAPPDTPLWTEPAVADAAERLFAGRVQLQTEAERALQAAQGTWDLAQFDLTRTAATRLRKQLGAAVQSALQAPQWRPARWAAVALVVANLAGLQAWAWKEQATLATKRETLRTILTSTFPDVRLVVDAPLQMARALADLQRQNGAAAHADLETMLGQFQALAPELTAPAAIEFVANELRLQGTGATAAALADLNSRLRAQGYGARLDGEVLVLRTEAPR